MALDRASCVTGHQLSKHGGTVTFLGARTQLRLSSI